MSIKWVFYAKVKNQYCTIYDTSIYIFIYHILFIHSSVDGHSGCFHILTNANNASMKIGVCAFSQFSHSVVSDSLQPPGLQHARLPCPSTTPRACSNSCPSSWRCHQTILSPCPPAFNLNQHQGLF